MNYFKEPIQFRHACKDEMKDYSKVHIPISFMPGKEKCLVHNFYRNLKEFTITKNGKYCLWGSQHWDEECPDDSMAYAYGDFDRDDPESLKKYKEFKQVVINFIKYIQQNDIERALSLTDEEAMFFTDDQDNCLIQEKYGSVGHCRAYFKQNSKYRGNKGEINLELFRENLMQIDVDNLRFYLDDITHQYIYSVIIPYEYKGARKYFDIRFIFGGGGGGVEYPYDNICYPKIYDLGINSNLPAANSY